MKKNKQKLRDINNTVMDFEKSKANQNFKEMVAKGLIKERGNQLLSSSEITDKNRGSFNVEYFDKTI